MNQLTRLGLNAYEAKAYLALLGKESFTAPQVADLSGVPRQRIYDILASLVERGLAVSRPNRRGTKYAAVAPAVALGALLEHEQQRLSQLQEATHTLITTLADQYKNGQDATSPLEYIEVLRGRTVINQRFAEIQQNCQREILILTKLPYATPPEENVQGLDAMKRHVQARSIYEDSVLQDEKTRRAITLFIRHGEEARFVAHLLLKLVIVDEEIVMFAMEDPIAGRTDLTIMVIKNAQLAQFLKLGFEAIWSRGDTFEQACTRLNLPTETPVSL